MKPLLIFRKAAKEFFITYPAALSGFIIYSYLFITILDFFRDVKEFDPHVFDIIKTFSTLIWMWLLALALVKIINYKAKLHEREKQQLLDRQELEVKQTQFNTMREVTQSLQHEINNPLTIMMLHLHKVERAASGQPELLASLAEIKSSTQRIAKVLDDFSKLLIYQTIDSPVGPITKPVTTDDSTRTMDEAGSSRS